MRQVKGVRRTGGSCIFPGGTGVLHFKTPFIKYIC